MGPTCGPSGADRTHVGPMNFAIWAIQQFLLPRGFALITTWPYNAAFCVYKGNGISYSIMSVRLFYSSTNKRTGDSLIVLSLSSTTILNHRLAKHSEPLKRRGRHDQRTYLVILINTSLASTPRPKSHSTNRLRQIICEYIIVNLLCGCLV